VLHQGTLQGSETTDKSQVLLSLSNNVASFVRWRTTLFNDASSLLLTDSKRNPSITTSPRLGSLPVIPFSTTTKANSTTAAQTKTEQDNPIFT